MSVALMFTARHLARYFTSSRLRTNGNVPSRLASVCGSEHTRTHQRRAHKYASSPEDRTRRVELRAAAPLVPSYSTARLDTRHDSLIGPRLKHPPLARALRPPAGDTVCKQRKNATRLFPPAIRIAISRRWRSQLAMMKVMKRDEHS